MAAAVRAHVDEINARRNVMHIAMSLQQYILSTVEHVNRHLHSQSMFLIRRAVSVISYSFVCIRANEAGLIFEATT